MADRSVSTNLFIAGTPFVAFVLGLAAYGVYLHLSHYVVPHLQRYEVRIQLMIPVYSVIAWLSIYYSAAARYYTLLRDIYQSFFIVSFFQLLVGYLGGPVPLMELIGTKPPRTSRRCCGLCGESEETFGYPEKTFVRYKRRILQYALVMPAIGICIIILDLLDLYQSGNYDPTKSFFWLQVARLVSALVSLSSLRGLLSLLRDDLLALNTHPIAMFWCIQSVVFLVFLQAVFISLVFYLVFFVVGEGDSFNYSDELGYSPEDLNNFITVVEFCFIGLAHFKYFGLSEIEKARDQYVGEGAVESTAAGASAKDALIPTDFFYETYNTFNRSRAQLVEETRALRSNEEE